MEKTHVLYNHSCPICRAEILHYRRRADALGAPLVFEALQDAQLDLWHLTPDEATRRLHARLPGGAHVSGIDAFAAIWRHLPRMRWMARAVGWPVLGPVVRLAYDYAAAPILYQLHRRRQRLGKPIARP